MSLSPTFNVGIIAPDGMLNGWKRNARTSSARMTKKTTTGAMPPTPSRLYPQPAKSDCNIEHQPQYRGDQGRDERLLAQHRLQRRAGFRIDRAQPDGQQ